MAPNDSNLGLWVTGGFIALFCMLGFISPFIEYVPEDAIKLEQQFCPPSFVNATTAQVKTCRVPANTLFGTDHLGRGVGMRLLKGIDAIFLPGLLAAMLAVLFGGLLGAAAGYLRGWLRIVVLRVIQLIDTLPRLVFIILVCTIFRPSILLIAAVAGVLAIPTIATVVRTRVEQLGSEDYILAHVAHGFRPIKILLYHILWLQCRPILMRQASFVFGYIVFIEAALCYLGDYGVQEPNPSWGNMIAQAKSYALMSTWPWLLPALATMLTIAAFLAFGNLVARKDEMESR
jgi:peptide/nickel transport system permease protein